MLICVHAQDCRSHYKQAWKDSLGNAEPQVASSLAKRFAACTGSAASCETLHVMLWNQEMSFNGIALEGLCIIHSSYGS